LLSKKSSSKFSVTHAISATEYYMRAQHGKEGNNNASLFMGAQELHNTPHLPFQNTRFRQYLMHYMEFKPYLTKNNL